MGEGLRTASVRDVAAVKPRAVKPNVGIGQRHAVDVLRDLLGRHRHDKVHPYIRTMMV